MPGSAAGLAHVHLAPATVVCFLVLAALAYPYRSVKEYDWAGSGRFLCLKVSSTLRAASLGSTLGLFRDGRALSSVCGCQRADDLRVGFQTAAG